MQTTDISKVITDKVIENVKVCNDNILLLMYSALLIESSRLNDNGTPKYRQMNIIIKESVLGSQYIAITDAFDGINMSVELSILKAISTLEYISYVSINMDGVLQLNVSRQI